MPGPSRKKRRQHHDTFYKRKYSTKHRTKDLDQVAEDLIEENAEKLLNQEPDPEKPGEGQFYCLPCVRYFIDEKTLAEHCRTKPHKRRLRNLQEEPYTTEESERAAGFGVAPASFYFGLEDGWLYDKRLERSVAARSGYQTVRVADIRALWQSLRKQSEIKRKLEQEQRTIRSHLADSGDVEDPIKEKLGRRLYLVHGNLRDFNEFYKLVERSLLDVYFSLPNVLDDCTPLDADVVVHGGRTCGDNSKTDAAAHGVHFQKGICCYLTGDAAEFQRRAVRYFCSVMDGYTGGAEARSTRFSNTDIINEKVVQCMGEYDSGISLRDTSEAESAWRLCGGGSATAWCATQVRRSVHAKYTPVVTYAAGEQYESVVDDRLYSAAQQTVVQTSIICRSNAQMHQQFSKLCEHLRLAYDQLLADCDGWPANFRICYQSARKLSPCESLRASIQLYVDGEWHEVGNVSLLDTYVSRRLLLFCHDNNNNYTITHLLHATLVRVPTLLAFVLQRYNATDRPFRYPNILEKNKSVKR